MRNLEPLSPTHSANPITPLMMSGQEEAWRASAGTEEEAPPSASAPEAGGDAPVAVEPESAAVPAHEPVARWDRSGSGGHASALVRYRVASLLLLLLGLGLGLAPVSPSAAQWLESANVLHLQAGTLIVAGLLLFTFTVVWRVLGGIRGSLEAVGQQTARLEQIALDAQTLQASLDTVRYANTTLAGDVGKLQFQVKRLTDIVSNPDYTVSIFRLAASVDQLGKHIEVRMKEQFEGAQRHAGSLADQTNHIQSQIALRLDQVQVLAKDQHKIQYGALQEGVARLVAASSETNGRVEKGLDTGSRIEARIQNQQEQLSAGVDSLIVRSNQSTGQIAAALEELGGRVDRQLGGHAESLLAKLTGIDGRIEAAHHAHASGIREVGGELATALAEHSEELQQKMRTMAELANANRQEISGNLGMLGSRMDDQSRNQLDSLERVRESGLESARTLQREVATAIAHLEAQLGETAREHAAVLRKGSQESQQAAGTARRELSARLEQIGMDFERQAREQQAALQKTAQELQQATGTTRRELTAKIETLGADLDRQTHDQIDAIQKATQESKAATIAAQAELAGSLEHLGSRLEDRLESRTNDLASDLIELAEMLGSVTQNLRSTLIESISSWADPSSESVPADAPANSSPTHASYEFAAIESQPPPEPDHNAPTFQLPPEPASAFLFLESIHPALSVPEPHEEEPIEPYVFDSSTPFGADERIQPETPGSEWETDQT